MVSALWGKFASEVLKEVKFKYDHNGIRQELIEHMEELYEDLQAEGMDASGAEIMTVLHMGDAKEIGQALNQEHNPILGWIWRISKWMVVFAFLICMVWYGFGTLKSITESTIAEYKNRVVSPLVYSEEVNQTVKWNNAKIFFDELLYYEDGVLELRMSYLNWAEPWLPDKGDETTRFRTNIAYETKDGRIILDDSDGFIGRKLGQGVYYKYQVFTDDFPKDATKLFIGYDILGEKYFEINLEEGREG